MSHKFEPSGGPPPSYPAQQPLYDAGPASPYPQGAVLAQPQQAYAPPGGYDDRGFFGGQQPQQGGYNQQQGYYNQQPQ